MLRGEMREQQDQIKPVATEKIIQLVLTILVMSPAIWAKSGRCATASQYALKRVK
jgi:hypothetical protein